MLRMFLVVCALLLQESNSQEQPSAGQVIPTLKLLKAGKGKASQGPSLTYVSSREGEVNVTKPFENGTNIYGTDSDGLSAMHIAVLNRRLEDILALLKNKFDLNRSFGDNETVLEFAIKNCSDMVGNLLELGAIINMTFELNGETYVHRAARKGDFVLMKGLIRLKADLNALDWKNNSAVKISVKRNDPAMLNLLAEGGANISNGHLLHLAVESNATDCLRNLLARGLPVNEEDEQGYTPIYLALRDENLELANILASFKADLNKAKVGLPLKDLLPAKKNNNTMSWLLDRGLNIDHDVYKVIKTAIVRDDVHLLQVLSELGVDMNVTDSEGSLLTYAARKGSISSIKWLVEQGLDINISDSKGWTPMHYAVYNKLITVKTLAELGARIDCKTLKGSTPLSIAKEFGLTEIKKYLEGKEEGRHNQV